MIGHLPILKMRSKGKRPSIVFVNDYPTPEAKDWHNPGAPYDQVWEPDHATVQIDEGDRIESLDLRFLTGLTVSATCRTEARAKALFDACKRAGVKTVAVVHAIGIGTIQTKDGWCEIFHAQEKQQEAA